MPAEQKFAPLRTALEQHGWTLVRISGSHHIFRKEGWPILSIPVHGGRVKGVYVRKIQRALGQQGEGGAG